MTTGKIKMSMLVVRSIFTVSVPILFLGCTSNKTIVTERVPVVEVPGTYRPQEQVAQVRNPEQVKSYTHGPYVDPVDPNVRHPEGHIDRLEQSASWNLQHGASSPPSPGPSQEVEHSAQATPLTAEFEQELVKQQKFTAAIMEQNEAMAERMLKLNESLENSQAIARENAAMKQKIEDLEKKMEQIDNKNKNVEKQAKKGFWDKAKGIFAGNK